jgi:putative mRNA 3-end processing factor
MKIKILGSGNEVGRSGIFLSENNFSILLDYGVKLQPEPPSYPLLPEDSCDMIITHAHLDHSGAIPILRNNKAFMTKETFKIYSLLIKDFVKVGIDERYPMPFTKQDVKKSLKNVVIVDNRFEIGDVEINLFDAGHIPGSRSILLRVDDKKIFYTGDIKLLPQRLIDGCKLPNEEVDLLVIESTYSYKEHPERKEEEERLKAEIDDVINKNGIALLPTFAVGRAQEMLLILKDYKDYIALDGMAKEATKIIMNYNIKSSGLLKNIFKKIMKVKNNKQREKLLRRREKNIIITTSGMLNGGPVVHYIKKIHKDKNSKILFTGFQVEGTPGEKLLKTSFFEYKDIKLEVNCKLKNFDFSSHAGRSELIEIIKKLNPKAVICVHGDRCEEFSENIEKEFGIKSYAPTNGEIIKIF